MALMRKRRDGLAAMLKAAHARQQWKQCQMLGR